MVDKRARSLFFSKEPVSTLNIANVLCLLVGGEEIARILVVLGSTREGRMGERVARMVLRYNMVSCICL